MTLLKDKYIYHARKKRNGQISKFIFLIVIAIVIIVGVIILLFNSFKLSNNTKHSDVSIEELWNAKKYNELITKCNELLLKNPMDSYLLAFKGFACFYKADSEIEEKNFYYDKAIVTLRKALLCKNVVYQKEIIFIIGVSYFYKDKYYNDLSVRYLEKTLTLGAGSVDALIRLGIAYGKLGNTEKELYYLLSVLSEDTSDWLFLLIGKAYFKNNQFDKAEEYFIRYINRTDDPKTEQEARFRLGEIYLSREDYLKAEEQFKEIIKIDSKSAEAHFNLGEIYFKFQDIVKARAEWRETLRIDPSHYGAKLRYYK